MTRAQDQGTYACGPPQPAAAVTELAVSCLEGLVALALLRAWLLMGPAALPVQAVLWEQAPAVMPARRVPTYGAETLAGPQVQTLPVPQARTPAALRPPVWVAAMEQLPWVERKIFGARPWVHNVLTMAPALLRRQQDVPGLPGRCSAQVARAWH